MKLIYELPATTRVGLAFAPQPVPLVIGNIKSEVAWNAKGGYLSGVRLAFLEQSVDATEPIRPPAELKETAFRFATYIANTILKQTGLDAINAKAVLHSSPTLEAETEEEALLLSNRFQTVYVGAAFDAVITKAFDTFSIGNVASHPSALALYSDGLRAVDPFIRFEMFYRVMEYFFPNPQNNAPRHLRNCPDFNGKEEREIRDHVQSWDRLRTRSVHPRPRRDLALHRDDLQALHEVRKHEPGMEYVARWLLDNPPL